MRSFFFFKLWFNAHFAQQLLYDNYRLTDDYCFHPSDLEGSTLPVRSTVIIPIAAAEPVRYI